MTDLAMTISAWTPCCRSRRLPGGTPSSRSSMIGSGRTSKSYEKAMFPAEIVPEMGHLGLLGTDLSGTALPAAVLWSTAWPRWNWRRVIPGCGPLSACKGRWP